MNDLDKAYIAIMHEFAMSRINEGFTRQQMIDSLNEAGISLEGKRTIPGKL